MKAGAARPGPGRGTGMRIFGVVGWKNSGKTGLVERLVAEITGRGFVVSTVKHAHHAFDVDQPGKDSFRHRAAGAREVLLTSHKRWALMHELRDAPEPPLDVQLARLAPCDLVIVEGYKREDYPKIEANRAATGQPLLAREDASVRAVASDQDFGDLHLPRFDLDDTVAIADFLLAECGLLPGEPTPDTARADAPIAQARAGDDPIGLTPPPLRDDCFALPAGTSWMPVDDALALLRNRLAPVAGQESVAVAAAAGRVLASDAVALRDNPPGANSAVDGYGFAHVSLADGDGGDGSGPHRLDLVAGRAAAGAPYAGAVPAGRAVRILTGALLPEGVDTVVMEEDVAREGDRIAFNGPVRPGANTRRAGEDVQAGDRVLAAGHRLRAPDLALLSALGLARVTVHAKLRVGVLSTGDELARPDGIPAPATLTYDANRPMLLAMARDWGHEAVDLGHVRDDRDALRARLDEAAGRVDVILTSGGASAGDEDHVSALLREEGRLQAWRIALKPGRPLALALWRSIPVFGLPGNPVAAFVTAAIFARPSLSLMAGGGWATPRALVLPAGFSKSKKAGRREYLRARLNDAGAVEVFASEGSGRISGLTWACGLVELPDEARTIEPGMPVRFLSYAALGLHG